MDESAQKSSPKNGSSFSSCQRRELDCRYQDGVGRNDEEITGVPTPGHRTHSFFESLDYRIGSSQCRYKFAAPSDKSSAHSGIEGAHVRPGQDYTDGSSAAGKSLLQELAMNSTN